MKVDWMMSTLMKIVEGDEKYEINSMGESAGSKSPAEKRRERWLRNYAIESLGKRRKIAAMVSRQTGQEVLL